MKLSQIISYKSAVEQWEANNLKTDAEKQLFNMLSDITAEDIGFKKIQDELVNVGDEILKHYDELDHWVNLYKEKMRDKLFELELPLIEQSYEWYDTEGRYDDAHYIRARYQTHPLVSTDNVKQHLMQRIKHYANWKLSGLFIRPESGLFVDPLVSCTPLYIADFHADLFTDVKQLWTKDFQERIRYYMLHNDRNNPFGNLPEKQIGYAVFYNFFNYMPLDEIERYLTKVQQFLKEGAVLILTYNNCDNPSGVQNAENKMNTFVPGRLLRILIEKIGYEIIDSVSYPAENVSWFEIKMPGTFKSLRGGQELAQVIKPD